MLPRLCPSPFPSLAALALASACVVSSAQAPSQSAPSQAAANQQQTSTQAATPSSDPTITSVVQPSSTQLAQAIPALHPDKWKLSGDLRHRTEENITSISNDLSSTLPNLLAAADADKSLSSLLAVSRNLHALYDVALRVSAASEIAAPDAQARALADSLNTLSTTRQQLNDRIDHLVSAQQQQISTLQTSLSTANANLAQSKAAQQPSSAAKSTTHTRPRHKPATTAPPQ